MTCSLVEAADPAFVGSLALLSEPSVAQRVKLTPEQQQQIDALIQRRESAAVELAITTKGLEPAERDRRQAEFAAESEKEGFAILSQEQQGELRRFSLGREGLAAMLRPEVAQLLSLTDEQKAGMQKLFEQRAGEYEQADERKRKFAEAIFNQRMLKVLDDNQRTQWESMALSVEQAAPPRPRDDRGDRPDMGPPGRDLAREVQEGLPADPDGRLRFAFRYAPWRDVLDWFSQQADLSLVMDTPPPGTFNYTTEDSYSPEEAIDLINSQLLTKGYTLVQRDKMLQLINLEDGIPPNLVSTVPMSELDDLGEFKIVSTLFRLGNIDPTDAEAEITKLLGPQGSLQVLTKARQMFVVETAGRLRTIRDVLRAMEDPNAGSDESGVTTLTLNYVAPDEAYPVIRQMVGITDTTNALADGSLRMATDVTGRRIMLTGKADRIAQVTEIVRLIDVPSSSLGAGALANTPQLEVYPTNGLDATSALAVLQTLFTDQTVRLATDTKTGNLIALALPAQHATIKATLDQMRAGAQIVEVIRLNTVDPQLAVLSINRLFGTAEETGGSPPKVDADITTRQLLVRGTQSQIEQIRDLLAKMGDDGSGGSLVDSDRRNVRMIPLSGAAAESVLSQIQQIWPTVRENKIRTVTPSAVIRSIYPRQDGREEAPRPEIRQRERPGTAPATPNSNTNPPTPREAQAPTRSDVGRRFADTDTMLAQAELPPEIEALAEELEREAAAAERANQAARDADDAAAPAVGELRQDASAGAATRVPGFPDIVISRGPNGLVIASSDLEALDEFEQLLEAISGGTNGAVKDFAVFYLKHSTAEAASSILTSILGGSSSSSSSSGRGGGGLLDSLAGAAFGDMGGMMGSLLSGGDGGSMASSGLTATGSYSIVPEPRLNLLVVQANATDMKTIENLLEIIDQRASPELVQTNPPARLIPVYYTSAEAMAQTVRDTFASQLASGPGGQQQRQGGSPEEFIRAMQQMAGGGRGGRGGRGGNNGGMPEQRQLTVAVDTKGNQLIVCAPDELFQQVQELVISLDQ
ncbi:MAG: hypothetical protein KDA92_18935, partial [Planctomycetales bacterium]|nr:hypothetical protein [Planctomycetales bacterium]